MREIISSILDRLKINSVPDYEHYFRISCSESIYKELQGLFGQDLQGKYTEIKNVFIPGYGTLELEKIEDNEFKSASFNIKRMSPKIVKEVGNIK